MTINLKMPGIKELKPKITVFGVGGAGGNAVNNMIRSGMEGVEFVVANTDSQALMSSKAERLIQMGIAITEGLGAGSQPDIGRAAAEEVIDEINDHLSGSHMVFVTAGMGGGTGTGAAPVIARTAREQGILTVGVVTKPFQFEGARRMRVAEAGIAELQATVDTLIVIPNQNLFRIANEKTTFADAFAMADQVLYSGVACITDLMVKEGLINLDFADVRSVMREMGKAMMGTGEASGDNRAIQAAEAAIANPLLDETSMKGARGLLISITGGNDLTLFEVDEAATRIREEVDPDANIILGATFDESLEGVIRVSVVATGIDTEARVELTPTEQRMAQLSQKIRSGAGRPAVVQAPAPALPAALVAAAQPAREAPVAAPASALAAVAEAVAGPHPDAMMDEAPPQIRQAPAPVQPPFARPAPRDPGVTIQPSAPEQRRLAQALAEHQAVAAQARREPEAADTAFIPPEPQQGPRRMPKIEDFPPVAQRELRAERDPQHRPAAEEDRGPMSLIRRLKDISLGRREEESPAEARERIAPPRPAAAMPPRPQPQMPPLPTSEYAKRPQPPRPAQGDHRPRQAEIDAHGRPLPRVNDDDHLEIPAFLRRQAN